MAFFSRHSSLRDAVALLLAVTVSACSSWRPAVGNPDALIAGRPDQVRVILTQGDTLVLFQPVLLGDTVAAYQQRGIEASRTTVLLRDIQTIQVIHGTPAGQVVALVLVVGLVAVLAVGLSNSGWLSGGESGCIMCGFKL